MQIEAEQQAHLGIFDPSDHFSIAQAGVLAFSLAAGMKIRGKLKDLAPRATQEFNDQAYHSPQNELTPDWDLSGFAVLARFALDMLATSPTPTACGPGTPGTNLARRARNTG